MSVRSRPRAPVTPVDPLTGPKRALSGRVVTMDDNFTVHARGVVYIDQGSIVAVQDSAAPAPPGFEAVPVVATGGTVFPGLIELHNHLSYNALQLWQVPKKFTNRDQWGGTPEYRRLVTGPMTVLGRTPNLLPAVIRYVECKCLFGGVTTTQGIELFSNHGGRRYYRGIVRNVEQTDDADLPEAAAKIADIEASDGRRFLARLARQSCFLLHLSEGTDAPAREHFLALKIQGSEWAITGALTGIHCAALNADDFGVFAEHSGSMVWSPLSNLLLYGATANVKEAKARGVRIALGSDWSPTGSKNLLGELKVAHLASRAAGDVFSDREIVALATRNAAAILKWDKRLGTLEPGKRADLFVVDGATADPYAELLQCDETSVRLVLISGAPRFGLSDLMKKLGAAGEAVRVGGKARTVNLQAPNADPVIGAITLAAATERLSDALARLPELARELERKPPAMAASLDSPPVWFLALDELADTGVELRPRLSVPGRRGSTGPSLALRAPAEPLSKILKPLTLDPLTVSGDADFLKRIESQTVLPSFVREGLRELY